MSTSSSPISSPTTTSSSGAVRAVLITRPAWSRPTPGARRSRACWPSAVASVADEQHHAVGVAGRGVEQGVELLDQRHQVLRLAEAAGGEAAQAPQRCGHVVLAQPAAAAGREQLGELGAY